MIVKDTDPRFQVMFITGSSEHPPEYYWYQSELDEMFIEEEQ